MTKTASHPLGKYAPIWIIYGLIFLAATVSSIARNLDFGDWMAMTMGAVALVFALFKLFDVTAFARDFAAYDVIAARWPIYGRAYPFLEAGIGVAFLAGLFLGPVLILTVLVFGVGLMGVSRALRAGQNLQCACVGKMFDLPLSRVALFENALMVTMALVMLISRFWGA